MKTRLLQPQWIFAFICIAIGLTCMSAVFYPVIRNYFFTYDDFYHIFVAGHTDFHDLFFEKSTNVYRPVAFAAWRLEGLGSAWAHPWRYELSSVLEHVFTSLLLGMFLWKMSRRRFFAIAAAIIFLCSPWSTESTLWASAQMDLLSGMFGMLSLYLYARLFRTHALRKNLIYALGVCIAMFLALCAKEMAVALPLLAAVMTLYALRESKPEFRKILIAVAAFALATSGYVILRLRIVGLFQSEYGSFWQLISGAHVWPNMKAYVRNFLNPPLRHPWGVAHYLYLITSLALIANAFRIAVRSATFCALGVLVALVPVGWATVGFMSIGAGRFMYLPGLWFATLLGFGFSNLETLLASAEIKRKLQIAVLCALFAAWGAGSLRSLVYQKRVWIAAFSLSHEAIESFRPYLGKNFVYISNLPTQFTNGAHIIKGYAFKSYFDSSPVPAVRVRSGLVEYGDTPGIPLPVILFPGDAMGDYESPREGEEKAILSFHIPLAFPPE